MHFHSSPHNPASLSFSPAHLARLTKPAKERNQVDQDYITSMRSLMNVMMIGTLSMCSGAALSAASDLAAKSALMQMGLARYVKVSRVETCQETPLEEFEHEIRWQEMGFASELKSCARRVMAAKVFQSPKVKHAKPEVLTAQRTPRSDVIIKPAFPDLSEGMESIMHLKKDDEKARNPISMDQAQARKRS